MRRQRTLGRRTDYQFRHLSSLVAATRSDAQPCVGNCRNEAEYRLDRPSDDIDRVFCESCLTDIRERGVFPDATVSRIDGKDE